MADQPVTFHDVPELEGALLIAAFTGWPDAGDISSASVRYLVRKLRARRFATIDPEGFHDFTQQRPRAVVSARDERSIVWPQGEFWAARAEQAGRDLLLFTGPEPQLRWRSYVQALLAVAARARVTEIMTLGSVFDAVPHVGEPKLSISGSDPEAVQQFHAAGLQLSSYQGPTSIHSALSDAASQSGIVTMGIWGSAPDYVQAVPNWKVCHAILKRIQEHYGLRVNLDEVRAAGRAVDRRVARSLSNDPDLRAYARQVQEEAGSPAQDVSGELDAASVLEEVAALLKGEPDGIDGELPGE